jgi:hypothetical protein
MALQLPWVPAGGTPCCCPADCCLYPWPDPDGTPLYPDTDLPDTVVVFFGGDSAVFTRSGYSYTGTLDYGTPTNFILDPSLPSPFDGNWWLIEEGQTVPQQETNVSCLIAENVSAQYEDEFADTYTVQHDSIPTYNGTVTRESLCVWKSSQWDAAEADCAVVVALGKPVYKIFYNSGSYQWEMELIEPDPPTCIFSTVVKDPPQSSPAGTYGPFGVT